MYAMAVITLQFGQCGNQMGFELLSLVSKDILMADHGVGYCQNKEYVSESSDRFFRTEGKEDKLIARTVLVDTETKVLERIMCDNANFPWSYDKNNIVKSHGGSANNWAYGHYHKGPELVDVSMNLLRKEIEKCDSTSLLLGILSSAGGTGSGVGSFILENVRDEFPKKTLSSVVVLPYHKGEVAIQSYNTLFTLTSLLNVSDAVVVFRNDYLHHVCSFQLNIKNTNLSDLNSLGMKQLASLFLCDHDVTSVLTDLTPHPSYKCITLDSAPKIPLASVKFEGSVGWRALALEAVRSIKTRRLSEFKGHKMASIANVVITRGTSTDETNKIFDNFRSLLYFPKWVPLTYHFNKYHQNRKFLYFDKYLTWGSNCSDVYWSLNSIVEKATTLFSYRAYVHQYKKYNVQEQDFLEAFTKVGSVINSYNSLTES